jgi:hypothetical protein
VNSFGEDAGPIKIPIETPNVVKVAAFVFEMQRHNISDRIPFDRAKVSTHTLNALRDGDVVSDDVLQKLVTAVEELRREATGSDADYWLGALALANDVGGRNKMAVLLGVSGPYLGCVLREVKPMTEELISRLKSRDASSGYKTTSIKPSMIP